MSLSTATPPVRRQLTLHSLAFVAGLSSIFIALGFSAGFVSQFLFDFGDPLRIGAGVLLTLLGLIMLRILPVPWLQRDLRVHMARKPSGYFGSGVVGVAFAAGWTPCIGPILAGILVIAGGTGSPLAGGMLLAAYAAGFAVPFLIAAQVLPAIKAVSRHSGTIEKIGGVLLIAVGILLLTNSVALLSPYLASLGSLEGALAATEPTFALSFVAGMLSFMSPCVLPILPSFLGYLTGLSASDLYAASNSS